MKKYLALLFAIPLFATTFDFSENIERQINTLRKFDVDGTFMNNIHFQEKLEEYKSENHKIYFFQAISSAIISLPTIKKLLAESKVPNEFIYLAMAESQFESNVFSNKEAAGMWQFIPSTAALYGLKVNKYIDERLDMIKSTKVAIKFLSDMHKRFGKWYLAAIAYNCGEGTLQKAIRRAGTDNLEVLIDPEKKYLPQESRIYIRKILALAILESNDYFFNSKYSYIFNVGNVMSLIPVEVDGGEKLVDIAESINMNYNELQSLNSHIINGVTPPFEKKYQIYIPHYKLSLFKRNYNSKTFLYVVKRGDTLYKIGKRYGCDYRDIKSRNNLRSNNLQVGQKLVIPLLYNSDSLQVAKEKENSYSKN
jgi:membrane-bound lytic murein transglycosylase D